mmetsp:Transcript_48854/g.129481  ORF Transcript_48854/g.129481 Transcript_48854/m.129481 type:complete len:434 (-) Transcript_48854:71-1372(-)
MPSFSSVVALSFVAPTLAIDNGLGIKPPMGWRSWNLFGANVNQSLIESVMDGMARRSRMVDGVPTSLCDLGYCDVGLDDNWQACGAGAGNYTYHDAEGKPIVNTDRFPDFKAMTGHAHSLGLTAGWYGNNCICRETEAATMAMYAGDVDALVNRFDFDAVKLDGCGTEYDLDIWASLVENTGKPIMTENCHWGFTVPTATWCPFNFFRTSGDVRASYGSVVGNLQTTIQWAQQGLSRPGCWAYPDMLEVGCQHGPGGADDPGLSLVEARSHFGAWAIVSSPLTLSHDVNNDTLTDLIWPIIANKEAIAVNQAWAGNSGTVFMDANSTVALADYNHVVQGTLMAHVGSVPVWQYFSKPLGGGAVAVFMMNHASEEVQLSLDFAAVPGNQCGSGCTVRDVWAHEDLGTMTSISAQLAAHDSFFFIVKPAQDSVTV